MSKEEVAAYLDAATEAIGDAEASLARGSFRSASPRAYYTMFYCASALLLNKGMAFSRHGNAVAAFGREFAKTSLLDRKFHLYIRQAFNLRQVSDYQITRKISRATAELAVQRAKEFLQTTAAYLAGLENPPCPAAP